METIFHTKMAAAVADVHCIVTQARQERHLILNLNYSHLSTLPPELVQGEALVFLERLFVKRNVLVSLVRVRTLM